MLLNSTNVAVVDGNELSRCCGGGNRHYGQTKTCTNIRTEGSSATCLRAANICCLRALLDDRCDEGARQARDEEYCPARINELGGGFRKVRATRSPPTPHPHLTSFKLLSIHTHTHTRITISPFNRSVAIVVSSRKTLPRRTSRASPPPASALPA